MQNINQYIVHGFMLFNLILSLPVAASDIDSALKAVQDGDYLTAYQSFSNLADEGDAEAQHNLAILYKHGKGVMRNFNWPARMTKVRAYKRVPSMPHSGIVKLQNREIPGPRPISV